MIKIFIDFLLGLLVISTAIAISISLFLAVKDWVGVDTAVVFSVLSVVGASLYAGLNKIR